MHKRGKIRVGRLTTQGKLKSKPTLSGYTEVMVMTPSSKYGKLGPYVLKNDQGVLMENLWQFSKVWESVPNVKTPYSQWDRRIIWDHDSEVHVDKKKEPNDAYWAWRAKGMSNKDAVRYPAGYAKRRETLYSLKDKNSNWRMTYIEARKEIYLPVYIDLVKGEKQFAELQKRLNEGENLLVVEIDGPHQESLDYYKKKYKVSDSFIENDTMLATRENLKIMLEDDKYSFGHGYCLAAALEGFDLTEKDRTEKKIKLE